MIRASVKNRVDNRGAGCVSDDSRPPPKSAAHPMQIGGVVRKVAMARWSRTLSTLIASGVDIMRALEITSQTAGNWVVESETIALRHRVEEGSSIAQPLIESEVFPPMSRRW